MVAPRWDADEPKESWSPGIDEAFPGREWRQRTARRRRSLGAPRAKELNVHTRGVLTKGQKRAPEDIAALTNDLRLYIAKNPGQRIEQIGKALGVPTKELALPARKLIAAGQVRTKGEKRATEYHVR
jgi:hypothetical protein